MEAIKILAHELAKQLVINGHSVHVVTKSNSKSSFEETIEGVNFSYIRNDLFTLRVPFKIRQLHERHHFDVIHLQNLAIHKSYSTVALLCKKFTCAPIISYVCQLPLTLSEWLYIAKHDKKEALWKIGMLTSTNLTSFQLDQSNKVVTTSMFLKKRLEKSGNMKFEVIPPFVNLQKLVKTDCKNFRKGFGIEEADPMLLYLGTHRVFRNEEDFLKCFAILLKDFPTAKAVFITTLPIAKCIGKLIQRLGIEYSMVFLPREKVVDMVSLMSACDVYVFSGFSSLGSIDPPLSVIEAKLLEIPVVAYDTGAMSEVITNGKDGLLVRPGDYRGLAEAVAGILKGISGFGRRESSLENCFDSRIAAERFISIYQEIARN